MARTDVAPKEKKIVSASAETVSHQPATGQKKAISESSLCESRVDSRKSRNSRASRVSVESPYRLCVLSSRDRNTESRLRASELSNYAQPTDNDHDALKNIDEVETCQIVGSKQTVSFESPTCLERNDSLKTPTNRRRSTLSQALSKTITIPAPPPCVSVTSIPADPVVQPQETVKSSGDKPRLVQLFKKIYNIVLLFRGTSRQLAGQVQKDDQVFRVIGRDGRAISFDFREFCTSSKNYGGLTKRAREALARRSGQRGQGDIKCLLEVINRLPVFAKYSTDVKEALADRLHYEQVGAGRVVIKQGHDGTNVYFVVSGSLGCRLSEKDPRTGGELVTYLPDIKAGATFGELAFVRKVKRSATVICHTDCELLMLSKSDFNDVVREAWEQQRRERLDFLHGSKYFQSWTEAELGAVADVSSIMDYKDNDIILGNVKGVSPKIYFLMSGKCRVIKQVPLVRLKSPHKPSTLVLPNKTSQKEFLNKNYGRAYRVHSLHPRNLTITRLYEGDYMGAGEDLENVYMIADGKAKCICMNIVQFEIFAKKQQLRAMAQKRQSLIPDNQSLHQRLMLNRLWNRYKEQVVLEVVGKKKIHGRATMSDVPWSIRMEPRAW
ncbi:uncharacterized protein LOC124281615 [Haliotis rubra]|uniref:uncharacterized protein LOC124281615 n=1 Tax=Haliotis rubra TaxID=36100 RepID=UPI001EE5137F|nr:uncharacterized protein LOC124281615 [Haliotis rubra]